jgi:hypothetical protein
MVHHTIGFIEKCGGCLYASKTMGKGTTSCISSPDQRFKNSKALLRNAKSCMLDPAMSLEEKDAAFCKAKKVIVYKDKEEVELRKLRAQWNKKKVAAQEFLHQVNKDGGHYFWKKVNNITMMYFRIQSQL